MSETPQISHTSMATQSFWMVLAANGNQPNVKHSTPDSAVREARRIAQKTGAAAYVLKAVCVVTVSATFTETAL